MQQAREYGRVDRTHDDVPVVRHQAVGDEARRVAGESVREDVEKGGIVVPPVKKRDLSGAAIEQVVVAGTDRGARASGHVGCLRVASAVPEVVLGGLVRGRAGGAGRRMGRGMGRGMGTPVPDRA